MSHYHLGGNVIGHGANAKLGGKDLIVLENPDGKLFIKMIDDLATIKGNGWRTLTSSAIRRQSRCRKKSFVLSVWTMFG